MSVRRSVHTLLKLHSPLKKYSNLIPPLLLLTLLLLTAISASGQQNAGSIYKQYCADCHGNTLQGGQAGSLINKSWVDGKGDAHLEQVIKKGLINRGMPAWEQVLSPQQIRSVIVYINEANAQAATSKFTTKTSGKNNQFHAAGYTFQLEDIITTNGILWGMDFLPDSSLLITQRDGKLWHIKGKEKALIRNTPKVWHGGQGGLLDVAVHPDYAKNGWVYLSFSDNRSGQSKNSEKGMTKVVRGKLRNGEWVKEQTLFSADENLHTPSRYHFGSRFVLHNGYLFFGVGDRGEQSLAQDLSHPNGKIFRLHDDGRIPKDNPFISTPKAMPEIWSYGHRNPQGMSLSPQTQSIWAAEHGPRGGDELNIIRQSKNYGWPIITYGINYNGMPITDKTHQIGMEQPQHYWTPSIAVSDIAFYTGNQFTKWQNKLLVSSLKAQELRLISINNSTVTSDEILFKDQGRVRDVATAPDGSIYLLFTSRNPASGKLVKMSMVK